MVTNGFLGTVALSADVYMTGTYNGVGSSTPSHRARIPAFSAAVPGPPWAAFAAARDLENGAFLVRYADATCSSVLEMRLYAHRVRRHLLLADYRILRQGPAMPPLALARLVPQNASSADFATLQSGPGIWEGRVSNTTHPPTRPSTSKLHVYAPQAARLQRIQGMR